MNLHPRPARQPIRIARWCALVLAVGALTAGGQEDGAGSEEEKKPVVLKAAEEEALRSFIERLGAARRGVYEKDLERQISLISQHTGLKPEQAETLRESIAPAIDTAMEGWAEKARDWLAPFVQRSPNSLREMARWPVEQIAQNPGVKNVTPPGRQQAWLHALRANLDDTQWELWQRKLSEDERLLQERINEHLEFLAENQRPNLTSTMEQAVATVLSLITLDEGRRARLVQAAAAAVDHSIVEWLKVQRKEIEALESDRLEAMLGRNAFSTISDKLLPDRQQAWDESLQEILSPAEWDRLSQARHDRAQRRRATLRHAMLLVLEDSLRLTEAQLPAVAPFLEPALDSLTTGTSGRHFNFEQPTVAGLLASHADMDGLGRLLHPDQAEALDQFLAAAGDRRAGGTVDEEDEAEPEAAEPPATRDEVERLLSAELRRRHEAVIHSRHRDMLRLVADVDRHTGLTPEQTAHLKLAALGAARDSVEAQRPQLANWLRQSLANAPPVSIRQRLASLGQAGFGMDTSPGHTAVWRAALHSTLTPEQMSAWERVRHHRTARLRAVQLDLVLSELDTQLILSREQLAFFEDQVRGILVKFGADLDAYNGSRRWHLYGYSLLTPVAGITEQELRKTLDERQFKLWEEQSANQIRHYWEGVKRRHDSRAKAAHPAAKGGPKS